jgi:hypothetical protein
MRGTWYYGKDFLTFAVKPGSENGAISISEADSPIWESRRTGIHRGD